MGGHLFLGGEGEELGGHKGYGLGLMVELMCSALSMGRWSPETFSEPGTGSGITHYFSVSRMDLFGDEDEIRGKVSSIMDSVRSSEKAEGQDRIFVHGDKEREARERSLREGIELDQATVDMFKIYSEKFGLAPLEGI